MLALMGTSFSLIFLGFSCRVVMKGNYKRRLDILGLFGFLYRISIFNKARASSMNNSSPNPNMP